MKKVKGEIFMQKFYARIAGAVAIFMTIMYAVLISNGIFNYISSIYLIKIINEAVYYGGFTLVIISTLAMVSNSAWIIKTIFIFVWVGIIIYSISPTFFGLIS